MNKTVISMRTLIARIAMFVGGYLTLAAVIGIPSAIFDIDNMGGAGSGALIVMCLVLGALGVWIFLVARKELQLIKKYKRYVPVLSEDPSGYIPGVAAAVGEPELAVMENVEKMVKKRYFANAHFDRDTKCLVVAKKQQSENTVTVRCSGCGGMNTVRKGTIEECAYCGAPIKG